MHEEEAQELNRCLDCENLTDESLGQAFVFGESGLLCRQCAERRGGAYDALLDRWVVVPDVSDLVERHLAEV